MSDVIKLLPDHIANQIAAGEVIQRPASVIKEMVENAIDAGASKVDVFIKDAGKTLIQIVDNGKGMSIFDARMCFERHATSKVSKAEDLFALTTKGFRGEALASIAAIAHVTLKTKQEEDQVGTILQIEGSKVTQQEPFVCPVGSSFEVKNLFYNVPARRNFLKSENVEFNHITDEFERIVLTHPEVSFTLKHNESEIYNLPSVVLKKRIIDVLGKTSNDKLVPIEENTDIVEIKGFVGKPEFAKKTRGEQFLFVNNRFFKDSFFHHAITKAFDGLIQHKSHPSYFLYLTVDPQKIDVNVHPTKTEIKFEEDRLIYAILVSSIRQALGKYNVAPTLDFERETSFDLPFSMKNEIPVEPVVKVNTNYNPFSSSTTNPSKSGSSSNYGFTSAIKSEGFGNKEVNQQDWNNFYQIKEEPVEQQIQEIEFEDLSNSSKEYILRGNFIITTCKSGLLAIQYRRAYERIIFDQMMGAFISNPIHSQQLLFPYEKEISANEKNHWNSNQTMLNRLGFSVDFEENNMLLKAVPSILQEESINDCIDSILDNISYREIEKGDIAHVLIQTIAASSSKKKNLITNKESIEALIDQLFNCSEHAFSPNGKKIMQTITLDEIANRF
ncbi:MAG: DNA mismatch repair endonuclease MutL [Flavobacteriia bacterium]|nr:DNA mismatch repair endonuclease MutL [Flavobacteriia bacterium]